MADMTDEQFRQKVLAVLNEKGADVTNVNDVEHITSVEHFGEEGGYIVLPGYKIGSEGQIEGYFSASLRIFTKFVKDKVDEIRSAWDAWFGTAPSDNDEGSGVQKEWNELKSGAAAAAAAAKEWYDEDHPDDGLKAQITEKIGQATSVHSRADGDHNLAEQDHLTAQSDHEESRTQSAYAKAQGDRAKELADRLEEILNNMQ